MNCFIRVQLIYILIPLLVITLFSCEQKAKEEKPPIAQNVVTMKITPIAKEPVKSDVADTKTSTPSTDDSTNRDLTFNIDKTPASTPENLPPKVQEAPNDNLPPKVQEESNDNLTPKPQEEPNDNLTTKVQEEPKSEEDSDTDGLLSSVGISGEISEEKLFYIAKGKTDPFEPLIKEKPPVEEPKETIEEDNVPQRVLTPLEKLDFSQMKLVAILNKEAGSVAMVQEASGKGYIVNIGTYIGRSSGQVVSIEKDKLVIQEKVKDYKGNVVDRFQELKLNKIDDKG